MPQSKKQNLKPVDGYISLPDYWSEEDKTNYELLVSDAKRYFPYMNDFVIHIGVMAHINRELGKGEEPNEEEAKLLMEKYKDNKIEYVTPYDPDFDFKSTLKEIVSMDVANEDNKKSMLCIEEGQDDEINETDGEYNIVS